MTTIEVIETKVTANDLASPITGVACAQVMGWIEEIYNRLHVGDGDILYITAGAENQHTFSIESHVMGTRVQPPRRYTLAVDHESTPRVEVFDGTISPVLPNRGNWQYEISMLYSSPGQWVDELYQLYLQTIVTVDMANLLTNWIAYQIGEMAKTIAFELGDPGEYYGNFYKDEYLSIRYTGSDDITIDLRMPEREANRSNTLVFDKGNSTVIRFRIGNWIHRIIELHAKAQAAINLRNAQKQAHEDNAFAPVDDLYFFQLPGAQLAQESRPIPSIGEQFEALVRRIVREEYEARYE